VNDFNAKLVIIDGIISLHRAEFAGRGTLADRQQRLNSMLHKEGLASVVSYEGL
jgi:DNA repair protein RadA